MRRGLGRDCHDTLNTSANLAVALRGQGKYAEAVEIEREVLVQMTRLLGAEHSRMLTSATNLAVSISHGGKKMELESEQILRDTLALARRALGLAHMQTLFVLQNLRAMGIVEQ